MIREELLQRVDFWRRRIVPEWEVVVTDKTYEDEDPDPRDCNAISRLNPMYDRIVLGFTERGLRQSTLEFEVTIVHELLHAASRSLRSAITSVEEPLEGPLWDLLWSRYQDAEEAMIDRLARVIVGQEFGTELNQRTRPGDWDAGEVAG